MAVVSRCCSAHVWLVFPFDLIQLRLIICVGNYKISNVYTQTAMSVSSTSSVVCAQYGLLGPVSPEWRLTALSDGLYRIESLTGLSCLFADASTKLALRARDQGLESRWKLRPSAEGSFLVENAANGLVLTLKDGSAEIHAPMQLTEAGSDHDIPWQKFTFERLDTPARSFEDVGSDKVRTFCLLPCAVYFTPNHLI